jgi:hypothetical protein
MISWYVDKFHDFLTLFMFYTIFKQLNDKFTTMFNEHGARSFRSAPETGWEINELNLVVIETTFIIVTKWYM